MLESTLSRAILTPYVCLSGAHRTTYHEQAQSPLLCPKTKVDYSFKEDKSATQIRPTLPHAYHAEVSALSEQYWARPVPHHEEGQRLYLYPCKLRPAQPHRFRATRKQLERF